MLFCDTCNAGLRTDWTAFSHPLLLSHMEPWNAPYAPTPTPDRNTTPSPSFPHSRFRLWLKYFKKKDMTCYHQSVFPDYPLTFIKKCTCKHSHPTSGPIPTCTPITRGLNLKSKFSTWLERSLPWGGLGPRPRRFYPSGFFPWICFEWGLVLADLCHPSPGVDFLSASSCCCVNYT